MTLTGPSNYRLRILVDRHLLRAERLLAAGDPAAALEAMNEILALPEEHDLELQDGFDFAYAQVAYAAGRTETAIASANQYLASAGRDGEFYREALELLDSAEVRLEREAAERRRAEAARRRAEAERRRAARWPSGHVFRDCETCPEMVVLPGSAVALGRYEVTGGEYRAFVSATGTANRAWDDYRLRQPDRHPVEAVNSDEAQAYVSWLSRRTGATYRLPSEAEWERAAAGSPAGVGCGHRNADEGPCPVGSYGENAAGLSDMLGNVWELTSDCFEGDCRRRVLRGGCWLSHAEDLRPAVRWTRLDRAYLCFGFRVARTLESPPAAINR